MGVPGTLLADDVVLRAEGVVEAHVILARGIGLTLATIIVDIVVEVVVGGDLSGRGLEGRQPAAGDAGGRAIEHNTDTAFGGGERDIGHRAAVQVRHIQILAGAVVIDGEGSQLDDIVGLHRHGAAADFRGLVVGDAVHEIGGGGDRHIVLTAVTNDLDRGASGHDAHAVGAGGRAAGGIRGCDGEGTGLHRGGRAAEKTSAGVQRQTRRHCTRGDGKTETTCTTERGDGKTISRANGAERKDADSRANDHQWANAHDVVLRLPCHPGGCGSHGLNVTDAEAHPALDADAGSRGHGEGKIDRLGGGASGDASGCLQTLASSRHQRVIEGPVIVEIDPGMKKTRTSGVVEDADRNREGLALHDGRRHDDSIFVITPRGVIRGGGRIGIG